jgi:hypothetical protein
MANGTPVCVVPIRYINILDINVLLLTAVVKGRHEEARQVLPRRMMPAVENLSIESLLRLRNRHEPSSTSCPLRINGIKL